MFAANDLVTYGSTGICRVTGRTLRQVNGQDTEYYLLKPLFKDNSIILVPTENGKLTVRMRPLLTAREVGDLLDSVPSKNEVWVEEDRLRQEKFRQILCSGNRGEMLQLARALRHRCSDQAKGKKLKSADERFLRDAEKLLCEEFAMVLGVGTEDVLPMLYQEPPSTQEIGESAYRVLDQVVCSNIGVCAIVDLITLHVEGESEVKSFYVLNPVTKPAEQFRIPVDQDGAIQRNIISRNEAEELLDRIPYITTIQAPNDRTLNELYREAMNQYRGLEWIRVIKTAYLRKEEGRLTNQEIQYDKSAKKYLYEELSVVLNVPVQDMEDYIVRYVNLSLQQ